MGAVTKVIKQLITDRHFMEFPSTTSMSLASPCWQWRDDISIHGQRWNRKKQIPLNFLMVNSEDSFIYWFQPLIHTILIKLCPTYHSIFNFSQAFVRPILSSINRTYKTTTATRLYLMIYIIVFTMLHICKLLFFSYLHNWTYKNNICFRYINNVITV